MVTTNKSLVEPPFNNTSGTLPNGNAYTSWDSPVNYNMTTLDNALGSTTAISVAGVTTPQTFTLAQYQSLMIDFTGVLSQDVVYSVPANVGGFWIISNSCTANFTVSISYNVGTVVIPKGGQYLVFVDTTTSPYINLLQISGLATNAGNPNGVLAGNSTAPASLIWDSTNKQFWICTTGGPPSTAVWANPVAAFSSPTTFNSSISYLSQALVVTSNIAAWDMSAAVDATVTSSVAFSFALPTNIPANAHSKLQINNTGAANIAITYNGVFQALNGSLPATLPPGITYFNVDTSGGVIYLSRYIPNFTMSPTVTVATTSGTSNSALNVPSWARRITMALNGIGTNGSSNHLIRLGVSGVAVTTGYDSSTFGGANATVFNDTATYAIIMPRLGFFVSTTIEKGIITLVNAGGNTWIYAGSVGSSPNGGTNPVQGSLSGGITLSGVLDSIFYTTANGTDIFKIGSFTVTYES